MFSIEEAGWYSISAMSENGDSVLRILRADTDELFAEDDGSGDGSDVRIRKKFFSDSYFVNIREYNGFPFTYSILFSRDEDFDQERD